MNADRIGVFLPCLEPGPIEAQLGAAAELGVRYVQPALFPDVAPSPAEWAKLKAEAERNGLVVSAVSAYQDYANPDGLEARIAKLKACLDLASELPNPVAITESGGVPFAEGEQRDREWRVLVDSMKEAADYAGKVGAYIAMEPGGSGLVASVESMRALLDEVNHPHMKLNLDPANISMFGSDAVRAARELGPHVIHAHAKDGVFYYRLTQREFAGIAGRITSLDDIARLLDRPTPPCNEVPLGEGSVKWREYLQALDDAGYTGPFVIEREVGEDRMGDIRKAVAFLRSL